MDHELIKRCTIMQSYLYPSEIPFECNNIIDKSNKKPCLEKNVQLAKKSEKRYITQR